MSRHLPKINKLKCHVETFWSEVWVKMGDLGETLVIFWRDFMEILKEILKEFLKTWIFGVMRWH